MDSVDRVLEQWAAERPKVDASPMAVVGRVQRACHLLDRGVADRLAAHGLQLWEFDILATLLRSGPPYRLSAGALVSASMVTSGAITNRIDRLVTRGLVTRETDPDNRRSVRITLTDTGRELVDRTLTDHVANESALLSGLTEKEQAQLAGLLRKLLIHLGDRP